MANLFQRGNFTLHSGNRSAFKIEADALTDDDIDTLAEMVRVVMGQFSSVEGIPHGGARLAKALSRYIAFDGPHLVVDDVLTTGGSIKAAMAEARKNHPYVVGCVIFARGQLPLGVSALFSMPAKFWPTPVQRGG